MCVKPNNLNKTNVKPESSLSYLNFNYINCIIISYCTTIYDVEEK